LIVCFGIKTLFKRRCFAFLDPFLLWLRGDVFAVSFLFFKTLSLCSGLLITYAFAPVPPFFIRKVGITVINPSSLRYLICLLIVRIFFSSFVAIVAIFK